MMNKTTWQRVKLGEICSTIDYGYTTSATNLNTGVKFLRITDIVPNMINWDSVPYCEIDFDKKEKYLLEAGDIVIARTGATTGYNKIIKHNDFQAVFASYLIRYKINSNLANPYFIFYHLQSLAWKGFVEGIIGGSAQPNANAKQFADFSFPLPPLETQQRIAEILSSLDDKIDLLHRQNKTLESLSLTLFRHTFIDNPNRDEWKIGKLGDYIEIFDNKRIPLSKLQRDKMKTGTLYPYYGAANIMDYVNDFIFDGAYILMGEDGTVETEDGYPILQYASGKFWVNNHAHIFKAKAPYNDFFILNFLKQTNISHIVTGAVQPKINQENLKSIPFCKYPIELVSWFIEATNTYFDKINANKKQIQNLQSMRDMLLAKILT